MRNLKQRVASKDFVLRTRLISKKGKYINMEVEKITRDICERKRKVISDFIYKSMNQGYDVEWYSHEEAIAKCNQLKNYIEDGSAIAYLAIKDNLPEGFIWAYPCSDRGDGNRVYISIVYINEECRGINIGKALINEVESEVKKRGYSKIWLHTNGQNINAIKFYEKIGFSKERIQYVKNI